MTTPQERAAAAAKAWEVARAECTVITGEQLAILVEHGYAERKLDEQGREWWRLKIEDA